MVLDALKALRGLQSKGDKDIPSGNFPSIRYHAILKFSREEDNVYFVSWILQCLKRNMDSMEQAEKNIAQEIIQEGEKCLVRYRSRYGRASYNFYRPESWFPGGRILRRSNTFQPTDDIDDTAIAYRGLKDAVAFVPEIREALEKQANGSEGKFLKRGPEKYQEQKLYNTWIGSKSLFVDLDLVVVCNVLMFNACYDLEKSELDKSNIEFLIDAVQSGLHLSEKWSLCAWYPMDVVILYNLCDLIQTGAYPELDCIKDQLIKECRSHIESGLLPAARILTENALMKVNETEIRTKDVGSLASFLNESASFTFGVIPLLHPFDGRTAQRISSLSWFRMHYRCDAQMLTFLIEHEILFRNSEH